MEVANEETYARYTSIRQKYMQLKEMGLDVDRSLEVLAITLDLSFETVRRICTSRDLRIRKNGGSLCCTP